MGWIEIIDRKLSNSITKKERIEILHIKSNNSSFCKYFDFELGIEKDDKESEKVKHYLASTLDTNGYSSFNTSIQKNRRQSKKEH